MPTFDRLAGLALRVDGYALEDRRQDWQHFTRATTTIHLHGAGEQGLGEDVTYQVEDHDALQAAGAVLDLAGEWTEDMFAWLARTGAVDSVDLKGMYRGTTVDQPPDPVLYRRVVEWFPEAWIEDPWLNAKTRPILEPHRDRVTWDAPIHALADLDGLPWPPRMVNVKPSRVGSLRELFAMYDACSQRGIGMYGGGQGELGVGRGQIQLLAAVFHPDAPNDVAPRPYNDAVPPPGLPSSPLAPDPAPVG